MKKNFLGRTVDGIARKFGYSSRGDVEKMANTLTRRYAAAQVNRLTEDWLTSFKSADAEIRYDIYKLRDRARSLERDNSYVRKFLSLLENNVLGSEGMGLLMNIREPKKDAITGKTYSGKDDIAGKKIADAFNEWCRKEFCTLSGKLTLHDVQKLVLRSTARDGECLVQLITNAPNKFGFSINLIESDQLDHLVNKAVDENGNMVRLGVEVDQYGKPISYFIRTRHPGDDTQYSQSNKYVQIPARGIVHTFVSERIGQTRGATWLSAAMMQLRMLDKYQESELVAARLAASKMGFFLSKFPDDYDGDVDDAGNVTTKIEAGSFEQLPMGMDFKTFDPQHPTQAFPDFCKSILREIASGLSVAYNTLASDLEGVNYSSIRAGLLEEREQYMQIQRWFIDSFLTPVFEAWLQSALLSGAIGLPYAKYDKFNAPDWKPRRWAWVDPLKDTQAAVLAIDNGLSSKTHEISSGGRDVETVFEELADEQGMADELGIKFVTASGQTVDGLGQSIADKNATAEEDGVADPGGDSPEKVKVPKN